MKRELILIAVLLVVSVGLVTLPADAGMAKGRRSDQVGQTRKAPIDDATPGESEPMPRRSPVGHATGRSAPDSRGALVAQTWRDWQDNGTIGRLVAVNPPSAGRPAVHFVWSHADAGYYAVNAHAKWVWAYNAFDGISGTLLSPGGVTVQDLSSASSERGDFPKVVVDPATGAAIVGGIDWVDRSQAADWRYHVYFDSACAAGRFGAIFEGSYLTGAAMDSFTNRSRWPKLAISVTASDTVLYLAGAKTPSFDVIVYRKEGKRAVSEDTSWHIVFRDISSYSTTDVATDPTSSRVAVSYHRLPEVGIKINVWYADSPTGLSGTWTKHNLTDYQVGGGYAAWVENCIMFDSEGKLHLMWPAGSSPDGISWDDRDRIFHWSEWNPTLFSTVYAAEWDPDLSLCGTTGNGYNACKASFGECDGRLYTVFSSYNDPVTGHNDDCASDNVRGNGENWVCVSKNLEGKSWDAPRNLSNTYTPGCDSGECADDQFNSVSIQGIDDRDFPGTPNWAGAYTYDPSGSYTGTAFTHVFYETDRFPGGAALPAQQGPPTLNDMRWIRLACVEPVTIARLYVFPRSIQLPEYTKPNTVKDYTLSLSNTGNEILTFSSITPYEDSVKGPGAPASGWLSAGGWPATIGEGESGSMTLTLNCGAISESGTVLYGRLRFAYTAPSATLDFPIEFRVTDTIVALTSDSVSTACIDLVVASNGNAGWGGIGEVNMDYYGPADCDTGSNSRGNSAVYLCNASPVIIRTPSAGARRSSWSMWAEADAGGFRLEYGFKPMTGAGYAPHGSFSTDSYDGYSSGTFVTVDSLVRVEKTWWAPKHADSCNFIVERTQVCPATIAMPVSNLQIGALYDFDVPTDTTGSGNVSGTDETRRLVWQRGYQSTDGAVDCQDNSKRYAGAALLNWFMRNRSCYDSLYSGRAVNNISLQTAYGYDPDLLAGVMHVSGYSTEPNVVDQAAMLTFRDGPSGYTLPANDTLTIFTAMATVRTAATSNAGLDSLKKAIDKAKNFMQKNLGICASCCQGTTGNVNMTGIVDLADLSALVSYLTGGGYVLPCPVEANVNNAGIVDLADLSALVSYLTGGGYALPACS